MRTVGRLGTCGIMANYKCTAACRHCLYACSPDREGGYIEADTAARVCGLLRKHGCRSAHIGGGEPFLDVKGLLALIAAMDRAGVGLDYIETNAFWARDEARALSVLHALGEAGADTLCISVDPFHAEYVPAELPLKLAALCRRTGMGYFLWREEFVPLVTLADPGRPHSRRELEAAISPRYILETANRYGIRYGGRAVNIEAEYGRNRPAAELLDRSPCRNLLSTSHYHVDWRGRFIPPGCTGVALPLEEAAEGIPPGKYPALEAMLAGGVAALVGLAAREGFAPEEGYPSKCALCFRARHWLAGTGRYPELDPEHYQASLSYYS